MTYADFGSVSTGTLRMEDLIPAFADTLEYLVNQEYPTPPEYSPHYKRYYEHLQNVLHDAARWYQDWESTEGPDPSNTDDVFDALVVALNDFAPPYGYFGSHPGDGADYGFWLYEGWREDFDGLTVSDLSEVPDDYAGEVLVINDHGNTSLYVWPEQINIWSVV